MNDELYPDWVLRAAGPERDPMRDAAAAAGGAFGADAVFKTAPPTAMDALRYLRGFVTRGHGMFGGPQNPNLLRPAESAGRRHGTAAELPLAIATLLAGIGRWRSPEELINRAGRGVKFKGTTEVAPGKTVHWYDINVRGGQPTTGLITEENLRAGRLGDQLRETFRQWDLSRPIAGGSPGRPNTSGMGPSQVARLADVVGRLQGNPEQEKAVVRLSQASEFDPVRVLRKLVERGRLPAGHSLMSDYVPVARRGNFPDRFQEDLLLAPSTEAVPSSGPDDLARLIQAVMMMRSRMGRGLGKN